MKNITSEWEIVHMERVVNSYVQRTPDPRYAVYLLHLGHAVAVKDQYLWKIEELGPPYTGYLCIHDNTLIPEEIMERWLKMKKFLIPTK